MYTQRNLSTVTPFAPNKLDHSRQVVFSRLGYPIIKISLTIEKSTEMMKISNYKSWV